MSAPFKVIERVRTIAYKLELPPQLSRVHNMFHVSNLKKCLSDESLVIQLEELRVDDKLHFLEEPMEVMGREIKQLKRNETVYKEWEDRMERVATTASSLEAEQDSGRWSPGDKLPYWRGAKLKLEKELVRINIDDGNAFCNEIKVNAGNSNLVLLALG
ncbi:hypothetical protein Tco_0010715 [Tanacetum coccineum]